MKYSIDEIFDMLDWNQPQDIRDLGIREASKIRHLEVLIQPIGKNIWDNCAKVLAAKSDDELEPYFFLLFEWLQDLTWPGAELIYDRLGQVPYEKIKSALNISLKEAKKRNDRPWQYCLESFLDDFYKADSKD